ncbi:membrane-bound metal-dependent hydrolase YbcI (DUF457 family) [Actinopolymorpha cephalotaxi]|nr:membrane-bound metal-dependent hydrolase YbcI (DUF457 family) [Actinopolymorpha cephalotaxi]
MAVGAVALPLVPLDRMAGQLAWVACCGGMALLPDLDHHSSTVTRMWGPLSRALGVVVCWLGRGHRGGTHDFLVAPLFCALLVFLAGLNQWALMAVLALAVGLALRACHFVIPGQYEKSWPVNLLVSAGAGWWLVRNGAAADATWLPFAAMVGVLVHIGADALTVGSIPKPFSWLDGRPNRMGRGPLTTGRWYEHVLAVAMVVVTFAGLYTHVPRVTALVDRIGGSVATTIGAAPGPRLPGPRALGPQAPGPQSPGRPEYAGAAR